MQIGELARRTGLSVQAIRFYERRGLLQEPPRTPSGYRIYSDVHLRTVLLIRKAQHLGFRLREIRRLVDLCPPGNECDARAGTRVKQASVAEIIRICEEKLAELDQQARLLTGIRQELAAALNEIRQANDFPLRTGSAPVVKGITSLWAWIRMAGVGD